jgi:hypothetical protein
MIRGAAVALSVAAALALAAPALAAPAARLQSTWAMAGRVTRADGVRGEHRGQHVQRTWTFAPSCAAGPCKTVGLVRERAAGKVQRMVLHATGRGRYVARGRFAVPLRCNGRVYPRGGVATTVVHVTVVQTSTVQTTPFATAVRATYANPQRINRTPCPGALGSDAGVYSGSMSTPLPAPPVADFGSSLNPVTGEVAFADASHSVTGAPLRSWSWDFGDSASGSANSSSQESPTHRYAAPGTYTVTLIVRDANGLTATISKQIVV